MILYQFWSSSWYCIHSEGSRSSGYSTNNLQYSDVSTSDYDLHSLAPVEQSRVCNCEISLVASSASVTTTLRIKSTLYPNMCRRLFDSAKDITLHVISRSKIFFQIFSSHSEVLSIYYTYDPHPTIRNEEAFLHQFLVILKHLLQNNQKIVKNVPSILCCV